MRHVLSVAALALAALSVSLCAGELALRRLTAFPITESSNMRSHPELLYTADPALADIDGNGFRNGDPPGDRYDIVAIGDSHTYGNNAQANEAWPARVAAATGRSVYNLGMGGYSIYQYDVLFDAALALDPDQIIIAIYPANDWMPDCRLLALPAWRERSERLGLEPPCAAEAAVPAAARRTLRAFLLDTAIGSALHQLVWQPLRARPARAGAGGRAELVDFEVGGHHFVFALPRLTNQSRGTDLSHPSTAAAWADGLRLIRRWREVAGDRGIGLAFAVIPSKQRVLRGWAARHGRPLPEELEQLTANEIAATQALVHELRSLKLPLVDALPTVVDAIEDALGDGTMLYPPGFDGHPYARGHAAYAEAILPLIPPASSTRD